MRPLSLRKVPVLFLLSIVFQTVSPSVAMGQTDGRLRMAFWNLENFFDPFADSTRVYNEFTENGGQHWTAKRFYHKRNNMYKAILALCEGEPLGVLGIAEVENRYVLNMLFNQTPLKNHNYRIVHYESGDRRGIDVAMAYCIDRLQLIYSESIKINGLQTRDILYAKLSDRQGDTLHVFVNHWPSRYGGERETIPSRALAAGTLRHKVDSLYSACNYEPKIIIMGDFNDTPDDPSIKDVLCAEPSVLVNLFADSSALGFDGTLKHQYRWQIFDQIIVGKALIDNNNGLLYLKGSARIFHAGFLFEKDETYGGVKLLRTYVGPNYTGSFSDHLPVLIDLGNR